MPVRTRPTGTEQHAQIADEEPREQHDRPSEGDRPSRGGRERVPQPTQGAARTPRVPRADNASSTDANGSTPGDSADEPGKPPDKGENAWATQALVTHDVQNLNKNIEKNDQSLEGQIHALQGRTAVLEQDNAALTASVDELQGGTSYGGAGGGSGVGGLLGFSTTTWLIIGVAVAAGIYFWNRSRKTEEVAAPMAAPPPPAYGGAY